MTDDEIEQRSLDEWMSRNHPEAERLDNGMFIEWLKRGEAGAISPTAGDWVFLNYRGTTIQGSVYMTRNEEEAKREGSFTLYTHYSPMYSLYSNYMTDITEGENHALSLMKKGDSVRMYLPSRLAYGEDGHGGTALYGYKGSVSVSGKAPVIIDMAIVDVIDDEDTYELTQVQNKALEWGIIDIMADTLRQGLYLDIMEENDPQAEIINPDSAIYITFTLRFLDGFLLNTNDPAVASVEWHNYSEYEPVLITPSNANNLSVFNELFSHELIRYDSKIRTVFTSEWGNGSTGVTASETGPVVYPYTPLMYEITIMPESYDPDDDETTE
jgi:FKBP-type peptidyl-prolyl cis-trans isomerase 2